MTLISKLLNQNFLWTQISFPQIVTGHADIYQQYFKVYMKHRLSHRVKSSLKDQCLWSNSLVYAHHHARSWREYIKINNPHHSFIFSFSSLLILRVLKYTSGKKKCTIRRLNIGLIKTLCPEMLPKISKQ